jgi:hypothetical protein
MTHPFAISTLRGQRFILMASTLSKASLAPKICSPHEIARPSLMAMPTDWMLVDLGANHMIRQARATMAQQLIESLEQGRAARFLKRSCAVHLYHDHAFART